MKLSSKIFKRPSAVDRPSRALASLFDDQLLDGEVTEPTALIAIELRGLAADTVLDGAEVWASPIDVIGKRLVTESGLGAARVARFAPHSFAIMVPNVSLERSVEIAEKLIVLCREPVHMADRIVNVDAAASVRHVEIGERVNGDQLIRSADAALRLAQPTGSPVTVVDKHLRRRAKLIRDVEREVRNSLDGDLLATKLFPVVNVRNDEVVGLRSAIDWTSATNCPPDMLESVSKSLGLARAVETQYLLRTIAAAESIPFGSSIHRISAMIDADRLNDPRFLDQISLLLRVCGFESHQLLLEFSSWSLMTVDPRAIQRLSNHGVGVGVSLHYDDGWMTVPSKVRGFVTGYSVSARQLACESEMIDHRADELDTACGGSAGDVVIQNVDDAATALELAANGLVIQTGAAHGQAMNAKQMHHWLEERAV